MVKVEDIFRTLCELAPLELQMDFDNSGFLVGRGEQPVQRVLLALDVTDEVIDEAIRCGVQLIVSHHPVIFNPVRAVTDTNAQGRRLLKLIERHIAVISMHTNLDIAQGGVNDVLSETLGIQTENVLTEDGCGRIGSLDTELSLDEFLLRCKKALSCNGLRYVDAGRPVRRVAVMGGSGADSLERAAALGCDTYVTADIKYHQFQRALELGVNFIDADHFCTENPVMSRLSGWLKERFPDLQITVSSIHHPIICFV